MHEKSVRDHVTSRDSRMTLCRRFLPQPNVDGTELCNNNDVINNYIIMMSSLQEIRDYSLSQTTLDDVFIHFASQQSEEQSLAREEEEEEERRVGHYGPLPDIVTHSRGVRGSNCNPF